MLARGSKYHYYVGFPAELFDIKQDPEETLDLGGDVRYSSVLAEFEAELRGMLNPEQVDRRAKEDQNALITRHGGRDVALKLGNPGATPTPEKFITSDAPS